MKMRCRINKNKRFKKLFVFLIKKNEYLGFIDSVYYDATGNADISTVWDFPMFCLHGKVTEVALDFFKAFFVELKKYVKNISVTTNRKAIVDYLNEHKAILEIQMVSSDETKTVWSFK